MGDRGITVADRGTPHTPPPPHPRVTRPPAQQKTANQEDRAPA